MPRFLSKMQSRVFKELLKHHDATVAGGLTVKPGVDRQSAKHWAALAYHECMVDDSKAQLTGDALYNFETHRYYQRQFQRWHDEISHVPSGMTVSHDRIFFQIRRHFQASEAGELTVKPDVDAAAAGLWVNLARHEGMIDSNRDKLIDQALQHFIGNGYYSFQFRKPIGG